MNRYFYISAILLVLCVIQIRSESVDIIGENCKVTDPIYNHTFDLSLLSNDLKHTRKLNDNDHVDFTVCGELTATCTGKSHTSACYYENGKEHIMVYALISDLKQMQGKWPKGPILHNDPCHTWQRSTFFDKSQTFLGDRFSSIQIGEPEYLGKHDCEHRFVWHTSLACNSVQSCVTMDSKTGFKYDLSSLAEKQYTFDQDNNTYFFGICNVAKSPCPEKVGICQKVDQTKTTSFGLFNDHLKFNQTGAPYLVYVGGSVCSKPSRQWTTKIEFLFKTSDMKEGPIVIENTDCNMIIHYVTEFACQKGILCKTYNYSSDTPIDLTPLINTKTNYLAEVNDTLKSTEGPPILHYLNVCKPLVPQYGLSCQAGSSACRAKNDTPTPTSELSLGYPDVSLTVVGSRALLKYFRGSACPSEPGTELSSLIEFFCDVAAGRGKPILQEILQECHYRYEWATNIMCPSHLMKFDDDKCEIFNDQLNTTVNLKMITDKGIVTVKQESKSFDLDICANNRKVETDYAQGTVKIFFDGKGPCKPDDSYSVELRLVCTELEKKYAPSETDSCGLVLIRETPLICPLLGITINPTDDSTKPDTTDTDANGEHTGGIPAWGAVFLTLTILVIVGGTIYMAINADRRAKVVLLFGRRSVSVQYSRTDSCGLVLIRETPLICPLLGITINPTDDSTKPDTTDTDANGEHTGGIPAWGAVFLTLTILVIVGGTIYMAINADRRAKVVLLFGRRSVSVQYSRDDLNTE